eukprot:3478002-Amphidinium_carterae.4
MIVAHVYMTVMMQSGIATCDSNMILERCDRECTKAQSDGERTIVSCTLFGSPFRKYILQEARLPFTHRQGLVQSFASSSCQHEPDGECAVVANQSIPERSDHFPVSV